MTTLDIFRHLQSPDGLELLAMIAAEQPTISTSIAVATRLRRRWPAELVAAALTMHELRARAQGRFPHADQLWFTRAGLEQASSAAIARHRAARYWYQTEVWDLCCGIGGDLLGLATELPDTPLTAVDRDPLHLAIATANAQVLGMARQITFLEADVRDLQIPDRAGVFIDPARRTGRGRLATGDSEPTLLWCFELAASGRAVGVKAAPGLDHDVLPPDWEFEAIAVGNDLKEAALWAPVLAQGLRSATVIRGNEVSTLHPLSGDDLEVRAPQAGEVLLDPNPAVTRSGLVGDLARSLPLPAAMIDPRIAFLIVAEAVDTPFARAMRIVDSFPWHEKRLKKRLRELNSGPVDVRRRGLAGDVDAIATRLRGRGDRPFMVAMTRMQDNPWAIICERIGETS
ncbi:MAG TPA: class I SAM-dependent methyltransferase [Thermomicrobiales bacterium]|nr:class I SAM-dependent methyltransferase [Thermomicrobiales bacterium]